MTVNKTTISLEEYLAEEILSVAQPNISAWIVDAARAKLRNAHLQDASYKKQLNARASADSDLSELRSWLSLNAKGQHGAIWRHLAAAVESFLAVLSAKEPQSAA